MSLLDDAHSSGVNILSAIRRLVELGLAQVESQMTESSESQRAAFTVAAAIARSKQPTIVLPPSMAEQVGRPLTLQDDPGTDHRFLRAAPRLRSFVVPILVFGFTALLAAIGISKLKSVEQPKPPRQIEAQAPPPPKQNSPRPEEPAKPVERVEPFRSLALDAAQSYIATGSPSRLTMAPANSGQNR
jgi:hypothetical protein